MARKGKKRGDRRVGSGVGGEMVVAVVLSSGVVRGVGTVHGPVGIGRRGRESWMGIDQPGGQQDAFAGYLL